MVSSEHDQQSISVPEALDAPPEPERPDVEASGDGHPHVQQMQGGGTPLAYAMGNPRQQSEETGDRKEVLANLLLHFWHGYRKVRDALEELKAAIAAADSDRAEATLWQVRRFLGPHARYEAQAIFPALEKKVGRKRIEALRARHRVVAERVRTLRQHIDAGLGEASRREAAQSLVENLLGHVTATAGQTLLIETLPLRDLKTILKVRERALIEGIELLEWDERHANDREELSSD